MEGEQSIEFSHNPNTLVIRDKLPIEMYRIPSQSSAITDRAIERYFNCHEQDELILEAIDKPKEKTSDEASEKIKTDIEKMMEHATKEEGLKLITQALESDNIKTQFEGAGMIRYISEEERSKLITQVLESDNPKTQVIGAMMIGYAAYEEIPKLITQALESDNIETQVEGSKRIMYATEEEIPKLITQALESDNVETQVEGAEMIRYATGENIKILRQKVALLITRALESDNLDTQIKAIEMMKWVYKKDKDNLLQLAMLKGLGPVLIDSPLYKGVNISETYPERQKFDKTGSEITLIGGQLKGKSIIRSIEPTAFLSWQRIYEDYEAWQKAGFDYVPVEPIQKYDFNQETGLVDVFSGVLDLSLAKWEEVSTLYKSELNYQQEKIIEVLENKKIEHNHTHKNNFVLCFFRHEDGSIDFGKVPRLYVIDFDQAVSK